MTDTPKVERSEPGDPAPEAFDAEAAAERYREAHKAAVASMRKTRRFLENGSPPTVNVDLLRFCWEFEKDWGGTGPTYHDVLAAAIERYRAIHEALAGPAPVAERYVPPKGDVLARDREVRVFLAGLFGTGTIDEARELCRTRFGDDRTPSRSAIGRFWKNLRDRA